MNTLLLIDGSNYFYRAYYAVRGLSTSKGQPTGAIRGFIAMIGTLRKVVKTDNIACIFDPKGKTFRSDIYPDYKATRPEMPEDLQSQIPYIFKAVELSGIPLLQIPGFEADDTIGTIAKRAEAEWFKVVIATGDKDFAQLVNENIRLINTMSKDKMWMDSNAVKEKFGVPADRIIDYLSLCGDTVDNVPGIPGCGPVTASKLINEYDSLDGIVKAADSIKGKIGNSIRENMAFLPIAKTLVTIKTDCDLPEDQAGLAVLKQKPVDKQALYEFYSSLEFRKWASEVKHELIARKVETPQEASVDVDAGMDLFGDDESKQDCTPQADIPLNSTDIELVIVDSGNLQAAAKECEKRSSEGQVGCLYVLTDNDEQQTMVPVGIAIGFLDGKTWYIPISQDSLLGEGIQNSDFVDNFSPWLGNLKTAKYCYDAKRTAHALYNIGITLDGVIEDVLIQSYVLEAHLSHKLENIALKWLNIEIPDEVSVLGKGVQRKSFADIGPNECGNYVAERIRVIGQLARVLKDALLKQPQLDHVYRLIELPTIRVLFIMEQNGVLIDKNRLAVQTSELSAQADKLCKLAYQAAGEEFNLGSSKQLGEILFDKMGVLYEGKKPKKNTLGNYSTSEEVLSELAFDYPLAKHVLEYRAITKLINTYTEKLPKLVSPKDGRVHTTFEQAVVVTGRLSSTNPNMQNIPVRTPEGRRVREAFIAPPGHKIISADYSQIELRVMAQMSKDEGFIKAFNNNLDIHRATAAEVFEESLEDVTSDQRRIAKVINFGLIYGMSAFGLAKTLGIDRQSARNYMDRYFDRYRKVYSFMQATRQKANEQGYVTTWFGRKLEVPDLKAPGARKAYAERAAINAPVQGTAADLIKLAMIAVENWIDQEKLKTKLILQVHDELVLEVPNEEVDIVKEKLPQLMGSVTRFSIPIVADVGVGDSWESAH